ncbi:MAG: tetratricopeptide repeat protein [Acidobacteriota bacterium]|nr:tetratricopeptide repeat protein [Acidobacteriota bacterium]
MSPGRPILGAVAATAAVVFLLAALDKSLVSIQVAEQQGAARRSYEKGMDLMKRGLPNEALEQFRQAQATQRESPIYTLALIEALTAVNKTSEADALADQILTAAPNDGETNLITARLRMREGRYIDAKAYFHRAIYGTWRSGAMAHERAARLELIQMLVKEKARQELLGELISLSAESGEDAALKGQIAKLFLVAGAPARAVALYQELVERDPHNAKMLEALGEAELQNGQYRAARSSFQQASIYDPSAAVKPRLDLLTEVTALDPTPRRLTSSEKYSRSLKILGLARDDLDARIAEAGPAIRVPQDTDEMLKQAKAELEHKAPAHVNNEMAERELDLAQRIWRARLAMFGPSSANDEEALRLIMERLAS